MPRAIQVYRQDAEPTPEGAGDLWITSSGVVKVCYRSQPEGTALWKNPVEYDITLQALTAGRLFVGNSSNLAEAMAPSADVSLSSAGAFSVLNATKQVWNATGSPIAADKLVAVLGFDTASGFPKIVLADADVAAHDDVWVTTAAISDAAAGTVKKRALSGNLDTSGASSAGDPVYLSTTAGGFVHTAPSGNDDRVHPVGWVVVKHASTGSVQWDVGPVRKIAANDYQALSIPAAALVNAILDGAKVATTANANVIGGLEVVHRVDVAAGTTGDVDVTLTHKTHVTDVWLIKKSAAGGGAGTIQVKNGSSAITNAMSIDVNDQTVVRAGTIDDATQEIAAAGTLKITRTRTASSDETCTVYVRGFRVA